MQFSPEPIITGSQCGRYKYQTRWCWDEGLPILGLITSRPEMGPWLSDWELNRAVTQARNLDYGAVSIAYVTPECSQYGFRQEERGVPQANRDLAAQGLLAMIDESAAVVCAWGAHHGGTGALQFILAERPHTRLFHLGLKNGNPKRLHNVEQNTRLTRWRV